MSAVHSSGRIRFWDGGSIWIGRARQVNDVHAHHAVQVALALEGRIRFRSPDEDGWRECTAAVITSNHPHAFDGTTAALVAHLFVEPQSPTGRALEQRYSGPHGICTFDDERAELAVRGLLEGHEAAEPGAVERQAQVCLRGLTDGVEAPRPADPRILRALDYIHGALGTPVTLEQVSAAVHLSPSRLRHLFVQEMGLGFRQYLLWRRLSHAVERYAAGDSLTTAAYSAGFADSAHLSRTFRRMYGLAAATLRLD